MNEAREEVLRRVRVALRDVSAKNAQMGDVDRTYHRVGSSRPDEVVATFAHRVAEYRANVRQSPVAELQGLVEEVCRTHGVRRLVVPRDLPPAWLPRGITLLPDEELSTAELNAADGVMTGCALAIAQTGTIVLDGGATQGRRALTLVPDLHLCVVLAEHIVELVPEAIEQMHAAARAGQPITLISGPSATSDIELHRVEGVHGPRRLEVIVVVRSA